MISIIKWTLWQRRISTIWWTVGVAAFVFLNLIVYPSFKDQADELQKSFSELPDAAVQLLGGSTDFFSPVGFMNSQLYFMMLPLLLGILGIALGSSLIAREEQDRTIETLLARPLSRGKLLLAKAVAGIIILLIVTFFSTVLTLAMNKLMGINVGNAELLMATFACVLLSVATGAIAWLLTATGRARGAALGIATLIAIGGYLVSSLAGTVKWLSFPGKLFPFHYYRSEDILNGAFEWKYILVFIGVIVICAVLSWIAFRRRDLA